MRVKLKDQHKASTLINNQKHRPNNWNNKDQTLGNIKGGKGGPASSRAQDKTLLIFPKQIYDSFGGTGLIYPHNLLAVHTRIHFFQSINYQITMEV